MQQFNRRDLDVRAREYGFNRDTFEKVLRLKTNDYLKPKCFRKKVCIPIF